MTSRSPQPGDRVRVTYEAEYVHESDGQHTLDVADGMGPVHVDAPAWASVEVLEPVDDPKVGEVRREDHGSGYSLWQVLENEDGHRFWRCTHSSAPGNRGATLPLHNDYAWSVIGACPGTPAAEAQGDRPNACPACGSTTPSVSRGPVNCMEPWHTPTSREPREFPSDGPEPPADVTVLEWLDAEVPSQFPYLMRVGGGWHGSESATERRPGIQAVPRSWNEAGPGRYREVVS